MKHLSNRPCVSYKFHRCQIQTNSGASKMAATASLPARASPSATLLCNGYRHLHPKPSPIRPLPSSNRRHFLLLQNSPDFRVIRRERTIRSASRSPSNRSPQRVEEGNDDVRRRLTQIGLWVMEGVYILWLFLLPYAPGDPVWAISSETINSLVGLSLNFFVILPFANAE